MLRVFVFLAVVLAASLTGCATTSGVDPKAGRFQKVGVLSVAGTHLTQMNVGITVFGNVYADADVSDWKLDDHFSTGTGNATRSTLFGSLACLVGRTQTERRRRGLKRER